MVARTSFARVRGLGAAGTGTHEYWLLKLTSFAMLPLGIFLLGLAVALAPASHGEVKATLERPYVVIPLLLFILANAVHMRHGLQNVIDDYVHTKALRKLAVTANIFFSYGVAAAAAYYLLVIGLGG